MYLWKSWHDSRDRVMLYGAAGLAIGVIFGISYIYYLRPVMEAWLRLISVNSPLFRKLPAPVRIVRTQMYQEFLRSSWEWAIDQVLYFMPIAAIWSALTLGATSVGREYSSGAINFVLTRPQSRLRIVWEEWALAIAEIGIILCMFYVGVLPFLFYANGRNVSPSAIPPLGILAVAACLCGLTQFLTMLTGSSMKGLSATVAVVLFYYFLPSALDQWWHIMWPLKIQELSLSVMYWDSVWNSHPFSTLEVTMIWALVAVMFPLFSQWLIERREA